MTAWPVRMWHLNKLTTTRTFTLLLVLPHTQASYVTGDMTPANLVGTGGPVKWWSGRYNRNHGCGTHALLRASFSALTRTTTNERRALMQLSNMGRAVHKKETMAHE